MEKFTLSGKIISNSNDIVNGCNVNAYDDDFLSSDDFLGTSITDKNGFFEIGFDESKFKKYYELLESTPDVYIVVQDTGGQNNLTTTVLKTQKNIKYRIKLAKHTADPNSVDIYSGNARRLVGLLANIRDITDMENTINLDILSSGNLIGQSKQEIQNFVEGHEERRNNLEHLLVIIQSISSTSLDELNIRTIDYDGPQVPRYSRREDYQQVIMWPTKENFKWE